MHVETDIIASITASLLSWLDPFVFLLPKS